MEFAKSVCWRVSKRGLLIGGLDGDALLLDHPRASELPILLADTPEPDVLAGRLGEPRPTELVAEMLEVGILATSERVSPVVPGTPRSAAAEPRPAETTSVVPRRGIVLTRSGAEFPSIGRPAEWLDRRLVPLLTSWPGRGVILAVLAAGVVALAAGRPPGPTVSAEPVLDALLGLVVMVAASAAHELAHAVALVHFDRRPRRAGFGFYWGGISFYVDSTEALTLPRRQRVVQALVGLGVDVVTVSLLAVLAQLSSSVLVVAVAWRLAVVGVADVVVNALPILEVDGHWALADYLDEPELAPRARAALGSRLRRLRRSAPASSSTTRTDRWLAMYGAASIVGGVALLLGSALVWWAVASDLVAALFAGSPAEVALGVLLVGPVALSLLASTAGLLLETALAEPATPCP